VIDPAELLTLPQAARSLGCEASTLRHALRQGRLVARRYGWVWLVERAEVERYRQTPRHHGGRPTRSPEERRDKEDRVKALTLRLPDELHARLVELAAREHRDLTHQIIALLEEGIDYRALTDPARAEALSPAEVGALITRALDREYRRQ
jgi:excisionase family DNA binding protein